MTSLAWLGPEMIAAGIAGMVLALLLFWAGRPRFAGVEVPVELPPGRWIWLLIAALVLGGLLRLTGLDLKGISHPEVYIPGIALPPGMSEPPPRIGFAETLNWHFHSEPHPMGYYLAMWGWTKAFGTSITMIRLPEALLGTASILAIYAVGRRVFDPRVGAVSAMMLALNGFHIFWSQTARMYAPGALLGLTATLLLLEISRRPRPHFGLELGYVVTMVAGAMTVEFMWPLLFAQAFWAVLHQKTRVVQIMTLALLVAAPTLGHSVMTGTGGGAEPPTLYFLRGYFSFGFAFDHGAYSESALDLPGWWLGLVLFASLGLLGCGLAVASAKSTNPTPGISLTPRIIAALSASIIIFGMALIAHQRQRALAGLTLLPIAALMLPWLAAYAMRLLAFVPPLVGRYPNATGLLPILAILAPLGIWVISFIVPLTAPRAFAIFVPYLLILAAAGLVALWPRRLAFAAVTALVIAIFAVSAILLRAVPSSPKDYRGLAAALDRQMQPGDLVFAPPRHWAYTPMFYYLAPRRLVASDYLAAVQAHPKARIWVLQIGRVVHTVPPTAAMQAALAGYHPIGSVVALRSGATLYLPPKAAR